MLRLEGVTDMDESIPELKTLSPTPGEDMIPEVAVMYAVPPETAVARPLLLTVATDVFDEVQVTCVVMSWIE
jgi:hypothetical protein